MSSNVEPHGLSRRGVLLGGAAACLLAGSGAWAASATARESVSDLRHPLLDVDPRAVVGVDTESPLVALTFDDGPDPDYTPAVLDILAHYDIKATFFMIGRNATAHPELVRRVLLAGHSIGNHTADHVWLRDLAEPAVRAQVAGAETALGRLAVGTSGMFRPPRGLTSPTVAAVTQELGLRSYFWNTCLEASIFRSETVEEAAHATAARTRPGTLVLCHDGGSLTGPNPQHIDRSRTVAALPTLIEAILARRLHPVTVPVLMASGRPQS